MRARPRLLARIAVVVAALGLLVGGLTTTAYAAPPSAPSDVTGVGGYRSITVSFVPPATNGGKKITGYQVKLGAGRWKRLPVKSAGRASGRLQGTVNGLKDATRYDLQVRALNRHGASPASVLGESSSAQTFGAPSDSASTGTVKPIDSAVGLTGPADQSPATGRVLVATAADGSTPTRTATCEDTSYCLVTGLVNGTTYTLTSTAFNETTVGKTTKRLEAKPFVVTGLVPWDGPQAPMDLEAQPEEDGVVQLSWRPADPDPERPTRTFQLGIGDDWLPVAAYRDGEGSWSLGLGTEPGTTATFGIREIGDDGKPGLPARITVTTPPSP